VRDFSEILSFALSSFNFETKINFSFCVFERKLLKLKEKPKSHLAKVSLQFLQVSR
jgi:hypothetical protein